MANPYELINLKEFSTLELELVASSVNRLVHNRSTRWLLRRRYLPGVIERHSGTAEQSMASLERARNADPKTLSAFAIRQVVSGKFVGMATRQGQLDLYKQSIPMPPAIARATRIGALMDTGGRANVAAWVGADTDQYSALTEAYWALHNVGTDSSWTREPVGSDPDIHTAILDAGFHAGADARFDDEETRWAIPPLSRFYRAL